MNWDKRKAKRIQLGHHYRATLVAVDGTWRRNCVLIDISETGARLRIDGSLEVLKARQFFLLLSTMGLVFRRCELVRLDGEEAGVEFITSQTLRERSARSDKPPAAALD
ncbi:PilZ domain-containing protein [Bradyrhizobium sp. Pa8]|uniref:PilZ domain-containing protein n=1 Tax=Bradyrhizobium sp. Pa8 TaxID=3386552 RepID=UPI00403F2A19